MPIGKIRSVLVCTDLSAESDASVQSGALLASLCGADLFLVHAYEPFFPSFPDRRTEPGMAIGHPAEDRLEAVEEALEEQIRRVLGDRSRATGIVRIGAPAEVVRKVALEVEADLLVLGPHRQRPWGDNLLGTTADRLVRSVAIPCLVVPEPFRLPLRSVCAPVDLADPALEALEAAAAWGAAFGAPRTRTPVSVMYVLPPTPELYGIPTGGPAVEPVLGDALRDHLSTSQSASGIALREEVVHGERPADEILSWVTDSGTDLLVLGTHGRGALGRMLRGSVSSLVARHAPCPVLLVPDRRRARAPLFPIGTGAAHDPRAAMPPPPA